MAYIGKTPTSVPLTSSDITDGIITTTKIADANVTNPKLTSGSQQNFRNIIINGDMSIAQRGTSATGKTATGYYTSDRFQTSISSAGTWTQSQSTDVPTGQGFATSLKLDCTTANGSLSSGSELVLRQMIEGQNLQYLKKGTANAESTTISFWVKSNKTGTYIIEIDDNDNSRNINKSYTISSADTWEKKTITFAGDTTGTLDNDNGSSFRIFWWLAAGSDFTSGTLATSWESTTNANRAVGQVNLADSTSNEFYITGVQLEAGTAASDFEFLPVDVNLNRCQRYFYKATETETSLTLLNGHLSGTTGIGTLPHPVTMRTAPSMTYSGNFKFYVAATQTSKTDLGIQSGTRNFRTIATSISGTSGQALHIDYDSVGAYIDFNSEL